MSVTDGGGGIDIVPIRLPGPPGYAERTPVHSGHLQEGSVWQLLGWQIMGWDKNVPCSAGSGQWLCTAAMGSLGPGGSDRQLLLAAPTSGMPGADSHRRLVPAPRKWRPQNLPVFLVLWAPGPWHVLVPSAGPKGQAGWLGVCAVCDQLWEGLCAGKAMRHTCRTV